MSAIGPGAGQRGLPLQRDGDVRRLFGAVALMAYVAGIGAVGLLALGRSEAAWRRDAAATMTLELPAETSPARFRTVLALLRQTRGIAAVRVLTTAETARLLRPWFGPDAQLDGLPLPRLIDLRAGAAPIDFAALHKDLASAAPRAKLDDNAAWLARLDRAAGPLRLVLATGIAAGLLAVAAAAMSAVGGAVRADRDLIELALLLGADDRAIIRPLVLRATRLGIAGGALGGLAGVATLAALDRGGALLAVAPVGLAPVDWRNWAVFAAVALATGLIAAVAARIGLARRLAAAVP